MTTTRTETNVSLLRLIITSYGQAAFGLVCVLIMGAGGLYAFQSIIVPQLDTNRAERDKLQIMATSIERASVNIETAAVANKQTAEILQRVSDQLFKIVQETRVGGVGGVGGTR